MAHFPTRTPMEAVRLHAEELDNKGVKYAVSVVGMDGKMLVNTEPVTHWYASGVSFIDENGAAVFVNTHNALSVEIAIMKENK